MRRVSKIGVYHHYNAYTDEYRIMIHNSRGVLPSTILSLFRYLGWFCDFGVTTYGEYIMDSRGLRQTRVKTNLILPRIKSTNIPRL